MADVPAVALVDIFSHFRFPGGDDLAAQALRTLPRISDLLQQARKRGWHVVYVNDNFGRWHDTFDEVPAGAEPGELFEPAGLDRHEIPRPGQRIGGWS